MSNLHNATLLSNITAHQEAQTIDVMSVINYNIKIATYTVLPAMFAVGLLGNILTLVIMGLNEITGTTSRYILISLACCDTTMMLAHLFNKQGIKQLIGFDLRAYSLVGCKTFFHIYRTTKMMSSWLVVLLCLERFFAVLFPLKVKIIVTKRRVVSLIVFIFIFLVTFNAFWTFSTNIKISKKKQECKQNVETDENRTMFRVFLVIGNAIFSWMPVTIMAMLTPAIVLGLIKQYRKRRTLTNLTRAGSETVRVSAMLVGVVIAYVIFIVPVTLFHINKSFLNTGLEKNTPAYVIVREIVQYLELTNYTTNFIMYAFGSAAYRNEVKRIICKCSNERSANRYAERISSNNTTSTSNISQSQSETESKP